MFKVQKVGAWKPFPGATKYYMRRKLKSQKWWRTANFYYAIQEDFAFTQLFQVSVGPPNDDHEYEFGYYEGDDPKILSSNMDKEESKNED